MQKLKELWAKVKQQITDLWDKDKGIFLLIAIAAIAVKFRDLLIDILINSGKRVKENADKKDSKLANQENQANAQAEELIKKASEEGQNQPPVGDDWYKKND